MRLCRGRRGGGSSQDSCYRGRTSRSNAAKDGHGFTPRQGLKPLPACARAGNSCQFSISNSPFTRYNSRHVSTPYRHHRRQRAVSYRRLYPPEVGQGQDALRPAFGQFPHRQAGGARGGVSAPAWAGSPDSAERTQSPRQHLGHEKLGVAWIISVSAVGSLQAKYRPCDIVLPDQFLDRTKQSSPTPSSAAASSGTLPSPTRCARNCGCSC